MRGTLLRTVLLAAASAQAACIVAVSGGGNASPTPTPAAGVNECILYFQALNNFTTPDYYYIEMPASKWSNGTIQLTAGANGDPTVDAVLARFVHFTGSTSGAPSVAGLASVGNFVLSNIPGVAGTLPGAGFAFTDVDLIAFGGSGAANGGQGSISGGTLSPASVFLDSGSQDQIRLLGTVSVELVAGDQQLIFGSSTASGPAANITYAGCFPGPSFLP
jgi:hypothetical protein